MNTVRLTARRRRLFAGSRLAARRIAGQPGGSHGSVGLPARWPGSTLFPPPGPNGAKPAPEAYAW